MSVFGVYRHSITDLKWPHEDVRGWTDTSYESLEPLQRLAATDRSAFMMNASHLRTIAAVVDHRLFHAESVQHFFGDEPAGRTRPQSGIRRGWGSG